MISGPGSLIAYEQARSGKMLLRAVRATADQLVRSRQGHDPLEAPLPHGRNRLAIARH